MTSILVGPPSILSLVFGFLVLSCIQNHHQNRHNVQVDAAALGRGRRESPSTRAFMFQNLSGRRVDLLWINRRTRPISYQSNSEGGVGYPYGTSVPISSFLDHEFEIRELPRKKTGECLYEECQKGYFQVNDQEDQKITVHKNFTIQHEDARTMAQDLATQLLHTCQLQIEEESQAQQQQQQQHQQQQQPLDPLQLVDFMTECMQQKVNETLAEQEKERLFQSQLRARMAQQLAPYACGDVNYTTSQEVINRTWHFADDDAAKTPGKYRHFQLQVFHERPTSQILQIPNFTTTAECRALPHFVVPAEKGEGSDHIPWSVIHDKTKQGVLVRTLASKLYEVVRATVGWPELNLDLDLQSQSQSDHPPHGQEYLFNILQDDKGMTVLPKCTKHDLQTANPDGITTSEEMAEAMAAKCRLPGETHVQVDTTAVQYPEDDVAGHAQKTNTIVADAFLFCDSSQEQVLGGIHFPQAAVHINPQPNLLVLALHQSPDGAASPGTNEMDGFTNDFHLCPNHKVLRHTFRYNGPMFASDNDSNKNNNNNNNNKDTSKNDEL